MRITVQSIEITKKLSSVICDCCKKEYDDDMDLQEFLSYYNTGGYSSVFGDGAVMSLDLCQDCVKKLLGEFIQFHKEDEE